MTNPSFGPQQIPENWMQTRRDVAKKHRISDSTARGYWDWDVTVSRRTANELYIKGALTPKAFGEIEHQLRNIEQHLSNTPSFPSIEAARGFERVITPYQAAIFQEIHQGVR